MLKRALLLVVLIGAVAGCSGTQTRASGPVVPAIPDNSATPGCELPKAGADGWVELRPECAAQVSRRSPRPLLLYFFTEWCGPCKDLDKRTFPDAAVRGFLGAKVVAVKVDCAPGPGKNLAESLGVNSYPTMVLLDPQGVEIERLFGFLSPQDLLRTLGDYLEGRNTAADLLRQANADPKNLALQFKAGRDLAIRGRPGDAEPLLLRVTEAATAPELDRLSASYLLAKTVYLDGFKQPDKAMPLLEVLIRDHMQTWQGREAFFAKATILVQAGQREEAARLLATVKDYQQKDPVVFQRLAGFCIQYQVAMEFAEEQAGLLVKLYPLLDWIWKTRAEIRFHSGDLKGAQEDLEHALSLAPENAPYKALLEIVKKRRAATPAK